MESVKFCTLAKNYYILFKITIYACAGEKNLMAL